MLFSCLINITHVKQFLGLCSSLHIEAYTCLAMGNVYIFMDVFHFVVRQYIWILMNNTQSFLCLSFTCVTFACFQAGDITQLVEHNCHTYKLHLQQHFKLCILMHACYLSPREVEQEDLKFKAIFGYIASWRPAWIMWDPVLQGEKKEFYIFATVVVKYSLGRKIRNSRPYLAI